MNTDIPRLNWASERIIGCAFTVANRLGIGFLERVYENALAHELGKAGLGVSRQDRFAVIYDGIVVGEYMTGLVVEQSIIVEAKAVRALDNVHRAQCMNYLRVTDLPLCLLLNFGQPRLEVRRLISGPP